MKCLCVAILCTVYVAAVLEEKADEEEQFHLLRILKNRLEQGKNEEETKKVDISVPKPGSLYRKQSSKKSLEKRGSACIAADECVFPFYYKGIEHNSCTNADSDSYWCSHAEEYSALEGYSMCNCLGCDPHRLCVFPFTYEGVTYQECTDADDDDFWCSTTTDYVLGSNEFQYCDCARCLKPPECTFPFRFEDKRYDDCTTDGSSPGEYWCSKTPVYSYWGGHAYCFCV